MTHNYCTRCGRPRNGQKICPCRYVLPDGNDNGLSFLAFLWGASGDFGNLYFERKKKIIPEILSPCDEEMPIKQYHLANFRSWLKLLWAEGRLAITNKRVIFRATGRSVLGRTVLQQEYKIEEIAGLEISKGVRFDLWSFLLTTLFAIPIVFAFFASLSESTFLNVLIALTALFICFLVPQKRFLRTMLATAATAALGKESFLSLLSFLPFFDNRAGGGFLGFFAFLCLILTIVFLMRFSLKTSVSLSIACKAGSGYPISLNSQQHHALQFARELLPAPDTEAAIQELGAIIQDLQQLGDLAMEKWKES